MHPQSLQRWINHRLAAWLTVLVLLGSASSLFLFDWFFARFEQQNNQNGLNRAAIFLNRDAAGFAASAVDYGFWQDSALFLAGQLPTYWQHFSPNLMRNNQMDWVAVLDQQQQPFAVRVLRGDQVIDFPAEDRAAFMPLIGSFAQSCHKKSSQIGQIGQDVFLLSRAPIENSLKTEAAKGCIIFGRKIDAAYYQNILEVTGVQIHIAPLTLNPPAIGTLKPEGHTAHHLQLPALNASLNRVSATYFTQERWLTMGVLLANIILVILMMFFAINHLIVRKIIRRIAQFSALADRYLKNNDHRTRWPVEGGDEIDHLGQALNHLTTQIEKQMHSIAYDAEHDALTGVGNRRLLLRLLEQATQNNQTLSRQAERKQADSSQEISNPAPTDESSADQSPSACLMLIDLDDFKSINDHLGHAVGDTTLCVVVQRIRAALRSDDTVIRVGSDEFAVWLPNTTAAAAQEIGSGLCHEIARPLLQDHGVLTVTASIGIALLAQNSTTELLRNTDLALYEAKRQGKNQAMLFNQQIHQAFTRRVELEKALRLAVAHDQIEAWFQPILDVKTRQVYALEALARWCWDGVYIRPDEFIPIAEDVGLIGELGWKMLKAACSTLRRLQDAGWILSCSVNVSIRQFSDSTLSNDILKLLQTYQIAPERLSLEVTETLIAQRESELATTLNHLSSLGLRLHLDDFGTGYSSLSRLQQLPLHALKIDRSFVTPLGHEPDVMVNAIVEMARSLGLKVIAEGVETEQQYAVLRQLNVDSMQGFLFAKPMSETVLLDWLANQAPIST